MAKEIPWEIREAAEELYIVDGKTFEEVAQITGVSITQLKRWGADHPDPDDPEKKSPSWMDRKKEYRQQLSDIKRDTVRLRSKLLKQALNSLNAQHVYAFTNIEQMAVKAAKEEMPAAPLSVDPKVIKTPEDAIDALQDLIENKLNAMLVRPGAISLAKIKEIKQAQELIDKMKEKYKAEVGKSGKSSGLSNAMAKEIREKILGATA